MRTGKHSRKAPPQWTSIRLAPELRIKVERLADSERRPIAQMIEILVERGLKEKRRGEQLSTVG